MLPAKSSFDVIPDEQGALATLRHHNALVPPTMTGSSFEGTSGGPKHTDASGFSRPQYRFWSMLLFSAMILVAG